MSVYVNFGGGINGVGKTGKRDTQPPLLFVIDVESRIRPDHPLRPLKRMIDDELSKMSALFDAAYSDNGRPDVPPERLLKALLLQAIYSVRSETQRIERIDTDLLFRWILDIDPAEAGDLDRSLRLKR